MGHSPTLGAASGISTALRRQGWEPAGNTPEDSRQVQLCQNQGQWMLVAQTSQRPLLLSPVMVEECVYNQPVPLSI